MGKKQTKEEKRNKQSQKRHLRNQAVISALKTAFKKAVGAINSKAQNAVELIQTAYKKSDQAAAKKIIHKNLARRNKSRLSQMFQKTLAKSAEKAKTPAAKK